jgi:hypothetical protein
VIDKSECLHEAVHGASCNWSFRRVTLQQLLLLLYSRIVLTLRGDGNTGALSSTHRCGIVGASEGPIVRRVVSCKTQSHLHETLATDLTALRWAVLCGCSSNSLCLMFHEIMMLDSDDQQACTVAMAKPAGKPSTAS